MALGSATIWEVETGGSDTLNGGAFDPGQTAGMFSDGAATLATSTAPVFTSASYNFVAGDVGAWVYVASGTNWTAGWYKIASVAANAATLNATIGQAVLKSVFTPSTAAGCATTASPTGATWTIDYSQQSAAQFAYTDLVSAGTGLTVSSVAKPFAKQQVGNSIVITGGTNFNTGRYVIASVAASVATVVGATNITTGAGATGTGGQGGALASPGQSGVALLNAHAIFIKTGTYSVTSASTSVAAGCFTTTRTGVLMQGYGSVRGDFGTPPLIQASGISTFTLITFAGSGYLVENLTLDGASLTSSAGFLSSQANALLYKVTAKNCTNTGISMNTSNSNAVLCVCTGCATVSAFAIGSGYGCEAFSNTITGFGTIASAQNVLDRCLSYNNSGASSDGFNVSSGRVTNCSSYGNGRDGYRAAAACTFENCIAETNTGIGFNANAQATRLINCAVFNNTGGAVSQVGGVTDMNGGLITGSASFFVNPGSGNLALNNTSGGGASARAAGIPGTFLAGTTTGFLDIGGAQHADPAGAAGMLFIPNLEGT